jgi:carbonic anhydrase
MAALFNSKNASASDNAEISSAPLRPIAGREGICVSKRSTSRRRFLGAALGRTLGGLLTAAGVEVAESRPTLAQTILTPKAALQELMNGNRRFAADNPTAHAQDLAILKQNTIEKQEPFAALLSCADSRVPVELIFDQSIGHLFVTRIAGNLATTEIIASLEYGVAVLGIKLILVMGHSNCGAVKAAIQGKEVPGEIGTLFPHIQPAIDQAGPNVELATKANAKIQAALLTDASTVISSFAKQGKVKVAAAYYDLATGSAVILY